MPRFLTNFEIVAASIAWPRTVGNTSSSSPASFLPLRSCSASRSTSTARPHSGTRCARFAFIHRSGTVHTTATRSISPHVASRVSAERAGVTTRNSNASYRQSHALYPHSDNEAGTALRRLGLVP